MSEPTAETAASSPVAQVIRIPLDQIRPSPHQARKAFDEEKLKALSQPHATTEKI